MGSNFALCRCTSVYISALFLVDWFCSSICEPVKYAMILYQLADISFLSFLLLKYCCSRFFSKMKCWWLEAFHTLFYPLFEAFYRILAHDNQLTALEGTVYKMHTSTFATTTENNLVWCMIMLWPLFTAQYCIEDPSACKMAQDLWEWRLFIANVDEASTVDYELVTPCVSWPEKPRVPRRFRLGKVFSKFQNFTRFPITSNLFERMHEVLLNIAKQNN